MVRVSLLVICINGRLNIFTLGQRARSTSRKRGIDDAETHDRTGSFYQSFSSPARAGSSTHSSPGSVNLPSPSMPPVLSVDHSQDPSPRLAPNNNYNFASPLSPAHLPSPHRYEFDYGVQPSTLSQSNLQQWDGGEHAIFGAGSDQTLYNNSFGAYGSALDNYGNYDTSDLTTNLSGLSTTPPSSSFAASGLPFRGLDFIRNYNSGGYPVGDQDALWQSYDPGAFGYDPDLPFTLGDTHTINELHDPSHH